jgi:hypothetical protein
VRPQRTDWLNRIGGTAEPIIDPEVAQRPLAFARVRCPQMSAAGNARGQPRFPGNYPLTCYDTGSGGRTRRPLRGLLPNPAMSSLNDEGPDLSAGPLVIE